MRAMRQRRSNGLVAGQSMVEFLFALVFFIMLVGFIRTFVIFELDVYNQSNVARYKTLRYVRGQSVDGQSFGTEYDKGYTEFNDKSFQKISSTPLRPIPFLLPSNSPLRQNAKLPERKLTWGAGTEMQVPDAVDVMGNFWVILGAVELLLGIDA